jgi:hypothetical protein
MTDAPTRIWAWPHFDGWITGDWSANTYHDDRTVEYILAAEHERIVADKDAEIAQLRAACNQSRLAFAGYVSVQSAIDALDRATLKGDDHD